MNSQQDFAVIKSQANFEAIILQALGNIPIRYNGDEIRANCPFKLHKKQNGFSANIAKSVWHCFSCEESGDLIKFIEKINKLSTKDAAGFIQEQSGNSTIVHRPAQEKSYTDQDVIDTWNNASSQGNDTYFRHRNLTPPPNAQFGKNPKEFYSTLMPVQTINNEFKGFVCLNINSPCKYNYFIKDDTVKFMLLGDIQETGDLFIGEGIATVQTVWEAFDRKIPAIAVGSWINMIPVLHELTTTYPQLKLIILLDRDKKDKIESMRTSYPHAICLLPKFQSSKMNRKDFNDIISKEHQPLAVVHDQITDAIAQTQSSTIKPAIETEIFEQLSTTQEKTEQSKLKIQFINQLSKNYLREDAPEAPMLMHILEKGVSRPFLKQGIVGMLVGAGSAGKTHFFAQLALSIAAGTNFLDKYTTKKAGSVFIGLGEDDDEDIHRLIRKHSKKLFKNNEKQIEQASKNLAFKSFKGISSSFVDKQGSELAPYKNIYNDLKLLEPENGWSLIIIDPISRFLGPEAETNNAAATHIITLLERLTQLKGNPTVLFGHHMNKGGLGNTSSDQTAARGSSALTDGVRWQANLEYVEKANTQGSDKSEKYEKNQIRFKVVKSNHTYYPDPQILERDENGCLQVFGKKISQDNDQDDRSF